MGQWSRWNLFPWNFSITSTNCASPLYYTRAERVIIYYRTQHFDALFYNVMGNYVKGLIICYLIFIASLRWDSLLEDMWNRIQV